MPRLSYKGDNVFGYAIQVTWRWPDSATDFDTQMGPHISPFTCVLQRRDADVWLDVTSESNQCSTGDNTGIGTAFHYDVTPDSQFDYRVVLFLDSTPGDGNYENSSPPSVVVSVRSSQPGVPFLSSTCTLDFGAIRSTSAIPLRWQVDTAGVAAQSFQVQRSENARDWADLSVVPFGAGEVTFRFDDSTVAEGKTYYYRLRSMLVSGTSSWSNIVKERSVVDDAWCDADIDVQAGGVVEPGSPSPPADPSGGAANASGGSGGITPPGAGGDGTGDDASADAGGADDGTTVGCGCRQGPTSQPSSASWIALGVALLAAVSLRRSRGPY